MVLRAHQTDEGQNSSQEPAISDDAPILTAKVGKSCDVFPHIMKLYVREGSIVSDTTFGKGFFWKHIPQGTYSILASDAEDRRGKRYRHGRADFTFAVADLRTLPYRDESVDVVVIDPPYGQLSSKPHKNDAFSFSGAYNLEANRGGDGVKELYRAGMVEAYRVLKPEGISIVKCQDFVNGGRQHWLHINLLSWATETGFSGEDLLVLIQDQHPMMRHNYQVHARKNHSYFWVFRKPNR